MIDHYVSQRKGLSADNFLRLTLIGSTVRLHLHGIKFAITPVTDKERILIDFREFGTITNVIERHPQHILVIDHKGHEIFVPAADEFIVEIERDKKIFSLDCPEGLIDIYKQ